MTSLSEPRELSWNALPRPARAFVVGVIAAGAAIAAIFFPRQVDRPLLFASLIGFSILSSTWKVNLPLPLANSSTLSVSYAADLMSLMLLGPRPALVVAMGGAWAQCTLWPKRAYPLYRTLFSIATLAITMRAVAYVYATLDGPAVPDSLGELTRPLVGIVATYFLVDTALVALAIALATREPSWVVWRDNFLWSAPSFMVAGGAGALAAMVIARGDYWLGPLMAAPVYLTYWTYRVFLGRLEDEKRHVAQTRVLYSESLHALAACQAAERALAAEKERLAVTLRSVGDGVIATDMKGVIRLMNPAAEILTGWSQNDALDRALDDVFHNIDPDTRERCTNSFSRVTEPDRPLGVSRSAVLVSREGRELPIQEVCAPLRDAEGRTIGMVVAFRDASDAIRIHEERSKASKLESLGLLAGGIAHDFNNILTAILGNISMARTVACQQAQIDPSLEEAEHACVRARQLTQQLLTFAKGGAPIKRLIRVKRVVDESVRLALSGSSVGWTASYDPDLWAVNADEGQLVQVFSNIIINAQQAMSNGGRIAISVQNKRESGDRWEYGLRIPAGLYVRVSVSDEGEGIRPEVLGRIVEPYFTTKATGSGLGLATSHSIIKNHAGYLAVESEVGRGTTVHVGLPASLARHVEDGAAPAKSPQRGDGRVLLLDDEEPLRRLATKLLAVIGYEAETVGTGEAAIDRYKRAMEQGRPFDVVLLDLTIPGGMGGAQVIGALREADPDVKAIVVSGYASDPVMARYREYGFKAVVAKPFTIAELSAALAGVIHAGQKSDRPPSALSPAPADTWALPTH